MLVQYISVIKSIRAITHLGLKEAKEIADIFRDAPEAGLDDLEIITIVALIADDRLNSALAWVGYKPTDVLIDEHTDIATITGMIDTAKRARARAEPLYKVAKILERNNTWPAA